MSTIKARSSEWRLPRCGGVLINGTADCILNDETGSRECKCLNPIKNFNSEMHMSFAQAVYIHKLHITKSEKEWEPIMNKLFTEGALKNCKAVQAAAMKTRFFVDMVSATEKKHGLNDFATGFEAHPDVTPYDELMIKMIKEIGRAAEAKAAEKEKLAFKNSSCLAVERHVLPVTKMTKATSAVLNDNGDVILL